MEDLNILFMLIFLILSILVISNTYNIYRLANKDYERRSIMDLTEFDNVHPMLKEVYNDVIVNGIFQQYNDIFTKIIESNDLNQWYETNKTDIKELIEGFKKVGELITNQPDKFKLSASSRSLLYSLNLKEMIESLKTVELNDNNKIVGSNILQQIQKIENLINEFKKLLQ